MVFSSQYHLKKSSKYNLTKLQLNLNLHRLLFWRSYNHESSLRFHDSLWFLRISPCFQKDPHEDFSEDFFKCGVKTLSFFDSFRWCLSVNLPPNVEMSWPVGPNWAESQVSCLDTRSSCVLHFPSRQQPHLQGGGALQLPPSKKHPELLRGDALLTPHHLLQLGNTRPLLELHGHTGAKVVAHEHCGHSMEDCYEISCRHHSWRSQILLIDSFFSVSHRSCIVNWFSVWGHDLCHLCKQKHKAEGLDL